MQWVEGAAVLCWEGAEGSAPRSGLSVITGSMRKPRLPLGPEERVDIAAREI